MAEQRHRSIEQRSRTSAGRPAADRSSPRAALAPAANDNRPPLTILVLRAVLIGAALAALIWAGWRLVGLAFPA